MHSDEKITLRRQIVRILATVQPCPDATHGRGCINCEAEALAEVMAEVIDSERLSR